MLQNTKVILIIVFWNAGRDGLKSEADNNEIWGRNGSLWRHEWKRVRYSEKEDSGRSNRRKCNKEGNNGNSMDTDEEFLRKHRMEKMNEKEEKVIVEPSIYSW